MWNYLFWIEIISFELLLEDSTLISLTLLNIKNILSTNYFKNMNTMDNTYLTFLNLILIFFFVVRSWLLRKQLHPLKSSTLPFLFAQLSRPAEIY